MAEQEQVAETAAADAAEFDAGFTGKPTTEVPPPAEEAPPAPAEEAPPAEPPPVKYAQITEAQWNELLAKSTAIDQVTADFKKRIDTNVGNYGELARTLKQLQSATPSGYTVEVTDDIVADIKTEFPELADLTLKAFKAFGSKLKGTAPTAVAPPPVEDPAEFEAKVSASVSARLIALQTEALEDEFADWRTIVGKPEDKENTYRKWLATQPAEYQTKLASTNSAAVIARSIASFQKAAAKPPAPAAPAAPAKPAASTRQQRLEAAVAPRGAAASASAPTDKDDFAAGFASG